MAGDAVELGQNHANVLRALRRLEAGELLDRFDVTVLGVELGQVIRAVVVADDLAKVAVLRQLLVAAVHVADDGIEVCNDLAVDGDHHAEDAVRGRVLRPDVDVDVHGFELALAGD